MHQTSYGYKTQTNKSFENAAVKALFKPNDDHGIGLSFISYIGYKTAQKNKAYLKAPLRNSKFLLVNDFEYRISTDNVKDQQK